jgi:hypothetical protein
MQRNLNRRPHEMIPNSSLRRALLGMAFGAGALLASATPAAAFSYANGNLNGQGGWTGHDGAGTPESSALARKLGTDSAWVERCAQSYGRRVKKQPRKHREVDEGLTAPQDQEIGSFHRAEIGPEIFDFPRIGQDRDLGIPDQGHQGRQHSLKDGLIALVGS